MQNLFSIYDNAVENNNVYGHALQLLKRQVDRSLGSDYIHLDLGCGFGRIAEHVRDTFGVTYVGVDADDIGLSSLRDRGFETHQVSFSLYEETLSALQAACNGRKVASVTMLDTLEHLPTGDAVLLAIKEIASAHRAVFVMSVPNVTHRDIGNKLAFGRWDYTNVGLLDYTHTRLFSDDFLTRILNHAGLHVIDSHDVIAAVSDQHFPVSHPALAKGTLLHELIGEIRGDDPTAITNQFVRACIAGPQTERAPFLEDRDSARPLLSIVTRTQGTRLECLAEVLTCLNGQTDRDFELIVVGHKLTEPRQKAVERCLDDSPKWLRDRTKLLLVDHGNRTYPLNAGFSAAQGHYIAILDDDDIVFANWVEAFRKCAEAHPGRLLRTVATQQTIVKVRTLGKAAIRAVGTIEKIYPSHFDLFDHLRVNRTPPVCVAFPRGPFHDLGIRFDEELTTTEDWDYILRVALVTGVSDRDEISSIYHWWDEQHQSSRTDHDSSEWRQNYEWILKKQDTRALLLPPKSAYQLRALLDERDWLRGQLHEPAMPLEQRAALKEVLDILDSTSWRWTTPVRWGARMLGKRREARLGDCVEMSVNELRSLAQRLRLSTSWKLATPLRQLKRGAR